MGVGTYIPSRSDVYPETCSEQYDISCDPVYRMVYIDQDFEYQDEDGEMLDQDEINNNQWEWEHDLRSKIASLLGPRFWGTDDDWCWQSGTLKVYMLTWETDYPLIVTPLNPLGLRHMDATATRLFDGLSEDIYKLAVRTGVHSARSYQKGEYK